jgi:hypothetical protein
MIPLRSLFRDERGSALLISLVMIVVITVLGLALFELGQIEGQQAGASLDDARAFELAQAGMERAIRELSNGFFADGLVIPYGSESWVDAPNRPTCTPACETAVYQPMNLANNTLPFAGADPLTGQDPGGIFTVELKQVLVTEANNPISAGYAAPYGQTCIPSTPANPTVCANLMFVRSTGTVAAPPLATGPPLHPATRTVQALVKAYSTSYFAGGLTAETAGSGNDPAIDGRVLIAGSAQILGTDTINPAFQITGGASMGMRNNLADLWPDIDAAGIRTLARLAPTDSVAEPLAARRRQLVCPTGASCPGGANLVESLGAELSVYGNTSNTMVRLNGGTDLGINAVQTVSAYGAVSIGSRYGKGRIDGVYVADGCPFPCTSTTFTFNGGSTIYVDTNNYTKPYPYRPPKLPLKNQLNVPVLYPLASHGTLINGTAYPSWYSDFMVDHTRTNPALSGGPVSAPDAVSAGEAILIAPIALPVLLDNGEFARISSSTANGGYCGDGALHTTARDYRTSSALVFLLNNLDAGSSDGSRGFCHTFKFMNKAGAVTVGEICWRRNVPVVSGGIGPSDLTARGTANPPPNYTNGNMPTLEFGSPSCSTPTDPSNPLLINFNGNFKFARNGGVDKTYQYRGSAIIFLNTHDLDVQQTLQTTCTASPCTGERFPEDNLLVFVTRGNGDVNIANPPGTEIVDRFMAYVYSERAIKVQKLTNLVGSFRAQQFCFNNSTGTNGCGSVGSSGGNPSVFQANFIDLRKIPAELPASSGTSGDRWLVNIVPRFWIECRRSPAPTYTLPTTPAGDCGYQ